MIVSTKQALAQGLQALGLLLALLALPVHAASLTVTVQGDGAALADAIVSVHSASARAAVKPVSAAMDQHHAEFVPHILTVTVGSRVRFPNSDNFRHQVYSFSPSKRFELPLYSGRQAPPVLFETAGVVELGCNIHDWMLGYVVVLDTPYFARTGVDGSVALQVPPGDYQLQVWHERQQDGPGGRVTRTVHVAPTGGSARVVMSLLPTRAPVQPADARLRALQERFRGLQSGG